MGIEAGHRVEPPGNEAIIADGCDGFQYHLAGSRHGPFIILYQKDGTNQTDQGLFVGQEEMIQLRMS
jgi:hypothetical protein